MRRGIFVLSFCMVMLCSLNVLAENGTCGKTCYWEIDNGVLTIFGTGYMTNYHQTCDPGCHTLAPWQPYKQSFTSVVVEKGILSIGNSAFYGIGIESISLPEGLEKIGEQAFKFTYLTSIDFPETLQKIADQAFCNTQISNIYLPQNVTFIGNEAFKAGDWGKALETFYCGEKNQIICQESLNNSKQKTANLKTYVKDGKYYFSEGNKYSSVQKMMSDTSTKFIYTIEEANKVAGEVNRVSITYR